MAWCCAAHRMIAERQREHAVQLLAQGMMQEHYGNRYFTLDYSIRPAERAEWIAKAEAVVPPVAEPEGEEGH